MKRESDKVYSYITLYTVHCTLYSVQYSFLHGLAKNPLAQAQSHKSPKRRGLRRGYENAELLLNQLSAVALVVNIFLLPPVLFIEQAYAISSGI